MKAMRFIRLRRYSSELRVDRSGENADAGSRRTKENEGMISTKSKERKNPSPSGRKENSPTRRKLESPKMCAVQYRHNQGNPAQGDEYCIKNASQEVGYLLTSTC